jgi:transposase
MTDTIEAVDEMINQDTPGQIRTSTDLRHALLQEFDHSPMTAREFAAYAGIKYSTFSNWVRAWRKAEAAQAKDEPVKTGGTLHWLAAVIIPPRLT